MNDVIGPMIEVEKNEEREVLKNEDSVATGTTDDLESGSELEKDASSLSCYKDVKSTAVVKYSTVPFLANYSVLQCNTDLNSPPSNWLSSSADSYGLQHIPSHSTGFSSFRMAHMFPECVGEVDVVSDAENIKKLLKIPYSKGPVSMMVHRIENTLLIDEFDIHKYLLRTAESEWEWLRKFFLDHVFQSLNETEKALPHNFKSRCALQKKNLVSKFLYHSLSLEQSQSEHQTGADNTPRTTTQNAPQTATHNPTHTVTLNLPQTETQKLPQTARRDLPKTEKVNSSHTETLKLPQTARQDLPKTEKVNSTHTPSRIQSRTRSKRLIDSAKSKSEADVPIPVPKPDPPLPEPDFEKEIPGPASNCKFTRNVVWTFEDIQMLIGTNLPIFGGKTHPCVSLRLRDMCKPINVLTGIDYWLDNLMCNVPELVMCYHLDGLVQKYELIKTEDLPYLENSTFSPKLIRDVAQNILSFLKSKATKAGHTYWLFKGKGADIVKLYDLTSLCSDLMDDKGQNPFTVPVGMLLYRVARNMKHSNDGDRHRGTIRLLLTNCIALLLKEKYPQIVTSAHYMLADLYIPTDTDPAAPNLEESVDAETFPSEYEEDLEREQDDDDVDDDDDEDDDSEPRSSSVHVQSLCVATSHSPSGAAPPPPLCTDVEERCKTALEHVAAGLSCLSFFDCDQAKNNGCDKNSEQTQQTEEPDSPSMARPFEAIPMPYTPLKEEYNKDRRGSSSGSFRKVKKSECAPQLRSPCSLLCKYHTKAMPTWQQPNPSDKFFWRSHLKILLYEKACLVYATLAERMHSRMCYGAALQHIGMVIKCHLQQEGWPDSTQNFGLHSYLLGRAGDLCFMIFQDWANVQKHREEYNTFTEVDKLILKEIETDDHTLGSESSLLDYLPRTLTTIGDLLHSSLTCYEKALSLEPVEQIRNKLQRRLGNAENEMGVLCMTQASNCYEDTCEVMKGSKNRVLQEILKKALCHLEKGIRAFETVHDEANIALLHSNTGRLMRMWGQYQCPDPKKGNQLNEPEKHFYNKALTSYQKALQVLGVRKTNPEIWDVVLWELSTALYNMATKAQDNPIAQPNMSQEETQREVIELFMKALKYCDCDTTGARQPVYQYRAATLHHRLGSLYQNGYRHLHPEDTKRRNFVHLARINYEKSCKSFMELEYALEYYKVLVERVGFEETLSLHGTPNARVKSLLSTLLIITQSIPMLRYFVKTTAPNGGQEQSCGAEKPQDETREEVMKVSPATHCENNKKSITVESAAEKEALCTQTVDEPKGEFEELLQLLERKMQLILLNLAKLHHCIGDRQKKDIDNHEALFKSLYGLTLRKKESNHQSIQDRATILLSVLEQVDTNICKLSPALKKR